MLPLSPMWGSLMAPAQGHGKVWEKQTNSHSHSESGRMKRKSLPFWARLWIQEKTDSTVLLPVYLSRSSLVIASLFFFSFVFRNLNLVISNSLWVFREYEWQLLASTYWKLIKPLRRLIPAALCPCGTALQDRGEKRSHTFLFEICALSLIQNCLRHLDNHSVSYQGTSSFHYLNHMFLKPILRSVSGKIRQWHGEGLSY